MSAVYSLGWRCFLVILLICIILPGYLLSIELKKLDTWKFERTYGKQIITSFWDSSGDLIVVFGIQPVILNKNKCIPFATFGQGPDEIINLYACCEYNGNLALFEDVNKIKIFKKKGENYSSEQTIWLKRDPLPFFLKSALFYKGYFFLAGMKIQNFSQSNSMDISNLQIYEESSKNWVKSLLSEMGLKPGRQYEIARFLIPFKDYVLYLKQNELKIYYISVRNLEVEKAVNLVPPSFYKPMPKDFYARKDYKGNHREYLLDLETWATNYSAITKAVIYQNDCLMVQVRNCSKEGGKFALLLYDLKNNCSYKGYIFLNDLLLAEKNGIIFCYSGGNPGLDDEAKETQINIYKIIE
jgi:hypothetical protein